MCSVIIIISLCFVFGCAVILLYVLCVLFRMVCSVIIIIMFVCFVVGCSVRLLYALCDYGLSGYFHSSFILL